MLCVVPQKTLKTLHSLQPRMDARMHVISAVANIGVFPEFALGKTACESQRAERTRPKQYQKVGTWLFPAQLSLDISPWMASTHRDRLPCRG